MALLRVEYYSTVLKMNMQMNVILPQETSGQIGVDGVSTESASLPVIYALHGLSGDQSSILRRTSLERYAASVRAAIVLPCAHRSWYQDAPQGDYFTHLTQEVPVLCRDFFPNFSQKREETSVIGISMGGYGALKAALTCPEQYGAVATLCAATEGHTRTTPEAALCAENNLHILAQRAAECGSNLPRVYSFCSTEDALYPDNCRLREELTALGYHVTSREAPGAHDWAVWDRQLPDVLNWLMEKPSAEETGGN